MNPRPTHGPDGLLLPLKNKPRIRLVQKFMDDACWVARSPKRRRLQPWQSSTALHGLYASWSVVLPGGVLLSVAAHRYAWAAANGREIPDGFVVHHLCCESFCVNPSHLALATPSRNSQIGDSPRRVAEARAFLAMTIEEKGKAA